MAEEGTVRRKSRSGQPDGSEPCHQRVSLFGVARASGEMADAHGSGPCVRKDVGVQLPPCPLWLRQTMKAPQASTAAGPSSYCPAAGHVCRWTWETLQALGAAISLVFSRGPTFEARFADSFLRST